MTKVNQVQDLELYQTCFQLQQAIFEISRAWPKNENYALTDQIRRSSRSVAANLAEAWAKRKYPAHFESKLTDSDAELQETLHWLRTAFACGYLTAEAFEDLTSRSEAAGRMLGRMLKVAPSFCLPRNDSV